MFSKNDIKDICALTPMQRGMLHHALLEPDSRAYHEQLILRLDGKLDAARMEGAWQQVIDRHDALRGRFLSERVSNPVQVIPHRETVTLALHHIADPARITGDDGLPVEVEAFLACDRTQGFDLANAHPMRLALFSANNDHHWLVWSFHHILLDGWSIGIVLDEVLALYDQRTLAASTSYPQYLRWLAARDNKAALAYWQNTLADFSGDALVAPGHNTQYAHASITVDAAVTQQLRTLAQTHRTSMHHLLLCAWALTAGRQLDCHDIIVPTVLAGRPSDIGEADRFVGLLINTVPMRVTWDDGERFTDLLLKVRDHSLDATRHQYLSMADIQSAAGKLPIDHVLLVQGMPGQDVLGKPCGDAVIGWVGFHESVPYALEVSLTPSESGIGIIMRGNREQAWLQGLADSMHKLLQAVAANPQCSVGELELIDDEQRRVLLEWGNGGVSSPHSTILQLFDAQLTRTPDALALICGGGTLTYRELDRLANRLAHTLLADGPLAPDTPVALVSHRDAGLLVGLLAILRAGAAYVPVDPEFPADRVRLMLEASGCRHVLASSGLASMLPSLPGVRILPLNQCEANAPDTAPSCAPAPDHLAYVIFTSGSTGTPKGAMLRHRNAASFFACLPQAFGFQAGDRILGVTTVSFDIAALELLGALTCGMMVVLASAEQARDPALLLELIEREKVNVLQMTPTRLKMLLDILPSPASGRGAGGEGADKAARLDTHPHPNPLPPAGEGARQLSAIHTLLVGGEALPQALADQLLAWPRTRVFNVYGPTETTIWSASWLLEKGPVNLGRALPGEQLLVLSSGRRLQPPGAIGEIAIAGVGVARGYLNDPARTTQRFITLPGIAGPIYLTGDLGRWTTDGRLQYIGRRDEQIKMRGMRIEIGEIEHHLRRLPGVQDAAAAVRHNAAGEPDLVAYLVGPETDVAPLRAMLATQLPDAMLPSRFVFLSALPQTPNGKTDRRALPNPQPQTNEQASRAPANPLEETITGIFSDILGRAIGPDDDFFLCGGHSLKAIQAIGRINRELGTGYTLRNLYRAPSAAALSRIPASRTAPITRMPDAADYPLSCAQQALWVLQQMQPDYAGYNVPGAYLLQGAVDAGALTRAWKALVARHESLRTVFRQVNGQPRQFVLDGMDFSIERIDASAWTEPSQLETEIARLTCRPFNLETGPLFRIVLLHLAAGRHILLLITHHIISDGWSDAIMVKDLAQAYSAALAGQDPRAALPPPPAIRYRDFAAWQQRYLASPLAQTHRDYWAERLRDLPQLELPTDGPRSRTLSRPGARVEMRLDDAQAAAWLAAIPPDRRYATLVAVTLVLLHMESGQSDLVLSLPVANRDRTELQDQVGLHLNMLPLRRQLRSETSLDQLRDDCADAIVEAMTHADYPFARLVDELGVIAVPGRHPVFDAMLIYHQHEVPVLELEGVDVGIHDPQSYTSRFDLDVEVWTTGKSVHGFIEYDTGLFTAEHAERMASQWIALLVAYRDQPSMTLSGLRQALAPMHGDSTSFLAASLTLDEDF